MKLFLDTNFILDIVLKRDSFFEDAARIMMLAEMNKLKLFVSSITIVNANYIACKFTDKNKVLESLKIFRTTCDILNVSKAEIDKALLSNFNDFEDAVLYYTAFKNNCNYIITRDKKDFKNSIIPVFSPSYFLSFYIKNKH